MIIPTVDLKSGFCQINVDGSHLHGGHSFRSGVNAFLTWRIAAAVKEGVHPIGTTSSCTQG
jgi:hypothetical protein